MRQPGAYDIASYLAALPEDRRAAIAAVRRVILDNLQPGFEEVFSYGMIVYVVPLARYPDTYNGEPFMMAALASQKKHMAVYLMPVYMDPVRAARFTEEYRATGKKLDMGKSCVRFKKLDDLPLPLIGRVIAETTVDALIAEAEAVRSAPPKKQSRE